MSDFELKKNLSSSILLFSFMARNKKTTVMMSEASKRPSKPLGPFVWSPETTCDSYSLLAGSTHRERQTERRRLFSFSEDSFLQQDDFRATTTSARRPGQARVRAAAGDGDTAIATRSMWARPQRERPIT